MCVLGGAHVSANYHKGHKQPQRQPTYNRDAFTTPVFPRQENYHELEANLGYIGAPMQPELQSEAPS